MATTTAAQRREQERAAYNAYVAECPSRQVLDALSDKWVTLVLTALADAPRRYSELSRTIAGVSQKMLTQTLRLLERDGLVTRTITASVPVRVDYQLTPSRPNPAAGRPRDQGLVRDAHLRSPRRPRRLRSRHAGCLADRLAARASSRSARRGRPTAGPGPAAG